MGCPVLLQGSSWPGDQTHICIHRQIDSLPVSHLGSSCRQEIRKLMVSRGLWCPVPATPLLDLHILNLLYNAAFLSYPHCEHQSLGLSFLSMFFSNRKNYLFFIQLIWLHLIFYPSPHHPIGEGVILILRLWRWPNVQYPILERKLQQKCTDYTYSQLGGGRHWMQSRST